MDTKVCSSETWISLKNKTQISKNWNQNSKTLIKLNSRHKIERFWILCQIFRFWFLNIQCWRLLQVFTSSISIFQCISNFTAEDFCTTQVFRYSSEWVSNFVVIVYRRFHLSRVFTKLGNFLFLFSVLLKGNDLTKKLSKVNSYSVKTFPTSHNFQETRASSTSSCQTNRAGKLILSIFGVAMQIRIISRMVFTTQEKGLYVATLRYGSPQIELSSWVIESCKKTIHGVTTILKLLLDTDNLFEHLSNFQKEY